MFKNKSFMEIANTFVADITMAQTRLLDGITNKIAGRDELNPIADSNYVAPFLYEGHNTLLLHAYWPPTWAAYTRVIVDHVIEEFTEAISA